MKARSNRRHMMPYRVLSVIIMAGLLALLFAAFSDPPLLLTARTSLLVAALLLLIVFLVLEIIFRDIRRLRERVRLLEKKVTPPDA